MIRRFIPFIWLLFLAACAVGVNQNTHETAPLSHHTAWQARIGRSQSDAAIKLRPVVVDDRVYTCDAGGHVYAFDLVSGNLLWQYRHAQAITAGVTADKQAVYIADKQGELIALNKKTGRPIFQNKLSSQMLAPAASNGRIVVAQTIDGTVTAYDIQQGTLRWRHHIETPGLTLRGSGEPTLFGNLVLIGAANGRIIALDSATGIMQWEYAVALPQGTTELSRLVDIQGRVVVQDNMLFAVSYQGNVIAWNPVMDQVLWSKPLSSLKTPVVDQHAVYISADDGRLWSLDKRTGRTRWQQKSLIGHQLSEPVRYKDAVIVADDQGIIHFFAADTGRVAEKWVMTSQPITAAPVVNDQRVIVQSTDGTLAAYTTQQTTQLS